MYIDRGVHDTVIYINYDSSSGGEFDFTITESRVDTDTALFCGHVAEVSAKPTDAHTASWDLAITGTTNGKTVFNNAAMDGTAATFTIDNNIISGSYTHTPHICTEGLDIAIDGAGNAKTGEIWIYIHG